MNERIFVVDDDRDHAESIAEILEMHGYEVELAFSGEEAIERFKTADFNITLMDVKLPGMNGVETYFEFRRMRRDARVIMMTGFSVEQLVAQAIDNGALGVLHKPFSAEDLLEALEKNKPRGAVLVADDDVDLADTIEAILTDSGYRVITAQSGDEALKKAQDDGIDCLLLDLRMPVLSGLEVFTRLRKSGHVFPTVFVTAYADEAQEALAANQPETRLLTKPVDPRVLLDTIKTILARKPLPQSQ
jgi:DNA-binding response OmpR family regulator